MALMGSVPVLKWVNLSCLGLIIRSNLHLDFLQGLELLPREPPNPCRVDISALHVAPVQSAAPTVRVPPGRLIHPCTAAPGPAVLVSVLGRESPVDAVLQTVPGNSHVVGYIQPEAVIL